MEMSNIFIIFVIQFKMISERQVELLLLARILDATENMDFFTVNDQLYSVAAIDHRVDELLKEFLEPYVIDNALKGD